MEEKDYTDVITTLLGQAAIENFKQSPDFATACQGVLDAADSSYAQINKYLNLSVGAGISVDTALTCASIYFKIKK
jgi:hypothetical protein